MSVNSKQFLERNYDSILAQGEKIVQSDFMVVFKGFEHMRWLVKEFPWPTATVGEPIEIAAPNGMRHFQTSQRDIPVQGQMTLTETVQGHVDEFMEKIIAGPGWGYFDLKVFEGTSDNARWFAEMRRCIWKSEPIGRTWDDRTQIMTIGGQITGHYFGKRTTVGITDGS